MKSVFHLCEAFFYIAWDGEHKFFEALNPWKISAEDNIHSDWDVVNDFDWELLSEVSATISRNDDKGFFLWIPLRKKSHLYNQNSPTGSIMDFFPGDDGLLGQDLSFLHDLNLKSDLASLLPLLRSLSSIEFIPSEGDSKFHLELKNKVTTDAEKDACKWFGEVVGGDCSLVFNGFKLESTSEEFSIIKGNDKWPKSYYQDVAGFRKLAPDKSKPEGSVVISHQDNQLGKLTIQWALFLPLGEETHIYRAKIQNSNRHIRIFVHGQFFVDAGRRGIHDFDQLCERTLENTTEIDETTLRRKWNQLLAQKVSLPLVIKSLDDYVRSNSFSEKEIAGFTQAITESISEAKERFIDKFRKFICTTNSWLKILDCNGSAWNLVDRKEYRLLPLPAPPNVDPKRPWHVLPKLDMLGDTYIYYDGNAPAIHVNEQQWSEHEIINIITGINIGIFTESTSLEYLSEYFQALPSFYLRTEKTQNAIRSLLKEGFLNTQLNLLRNNRQKIVNLVKFLLPHNRLSIGTQDAAAKGAIPEHIYSTLWASGAEVLIVPKDLDDYENPGTAYLHRDDALLLLRALHSTIESNPLHNTTIERCLDVANLILSSLDENNRGAILRTNPDLKIIQVVDAKTLRNVAVSYATLETARKRNNLFGLTQGTNIQTRAGYSKLLTDVLPEEKILLTNLESFKIYFGNTEILPSSGNGENILMSLGNIIKKLGPMSSRQKLIEYVDNPGQDFLALMGLRYLLHGDEVHFSDEKTHLWVARHRQSTAWEKLWRQVSNIEAENAWNILDRGLVENLPSGRWNSLGIKEIDPDEVINELSIIGSNHITSNQFTDKECDEILSSIDNMDVWLRLPFHTIKTGKKGRIDSNTFLDMGISLPNSLASTIQIVENSYIPAIAKKQKEWIPRLDEAAIVQIALDYECPAKYWRLIVEMLEKNSIYDRINTVRNLKETCWLPLYNGKIIRPVDVIDLPAMSQHVQILASKAGYCYASVDDLEKEIRASASLSFMRSICFSKDNEALKILGFLMAEVPGYTVGQVNLPDDTRFQKILPTFNKIKKLPAWKIFTSSVEEYGIDRCSEYLLPEILKPIQAEDLVIVLNELATHTDTRNIEIDSVFNIYLELFCKDYDQAVEFLPQIKLKSVSGEWIKTDNLCYGAADVSNDSLLEEKHAKILDDIIADTSRYIDKNPKPISISQSGDAQQTIKSYFNDWKGLVQDELIGAAISLMGPKLRSLADEYLEPHTSDWLYDQISWRDADCVISDGYGNKTTIPKRVYRTNWDHLDVEVKIIADKLVNVISITGNKIQVPLSDNFTTIIAGSLEGYGNFKYVIPLRKIITNNYSNDELTELVKNTISYILDKCYYQTNTDLNELLQELSKSDQLQIDVVRGMILDHLPFYLPQLNANRRNDKLKKALEGYHDARVRYQESKSSLKTPVEKHEQLLKELDKQKSRIAQLLQNDEEVRKTVLEGLKQKLMDFQYDLQSLPFELFQNSDDAAVELGSFESGGKVPSPAQKMVIDIDGSTIRFMHWGRKINSNPDRSKNLGFHRDLEKMLVLSSSDKQSNDEVTGKFGLGFKSVFLCCDQPRLLSGRLCVEVIGGVLPRSWSPSQLTISKLKQYSEDQQYQGTVIELDLNDEAQVDDLLIRFKIMAGLLSVFGRAIKRINLFPSNGDQIYEWQPFTLSDGIEIGDCRLPVDKEVVTRQGLVFRLKNGSVFFVISPEGFCRLPKEVPSLWVTSPTRENESLGFAVNAAFSLDAGRGRLAGDSQSNIDCAEKIGKELGVKLSSLISILERDWLFVKEHLNLVDSLSPAGLLATLWKTLSIAAINTDGTGICSSVAKTALIKLSHGPIPNALPIPYEQLVTNDLIRHELSGPWVYREVIEQLVNLGIPPDQCVSTDISVLLKRIGLGANIDKFSFTSIMHLIERDCCDEAIAATLETIALIVWEQLKEDEKTQSAEVFSKLLFKNVSGLWKSSRDLLCVGNVDNKEEELRINFAPDSARLADVYDEIGRAFFKRSRPRFEAPTELLVEWVRKADCEPKQSAALYYLVHGELGHKVARSLRQNGLSGTWLSGVSESHHCLENWSYSDKEELLRMLVKVQFDLSDFPPSISNKPPLSPNKVLGAIYDWWLANKVTQIEKYERKSFPGGVFPPLDFDLLKKEPEARKGWLTLFLLGAFHTIGRAKPEQHRSFINLCQSKGWMDRFVTVGQTGLDEWMAVIKNYLQDEMQDPEYYQWMKEFVSFFLLGYWLDEYVESFKAIDRMKDPFSLKQITAPRINPAFQGGGPDAPPIDRALGMGACFVMRELARKKIINNQLAHRYCYVPRRPVRNLLERLGCHGLNNGFDHETRSKMIHEFLCTHLGDKKATFENSYDLPLLIVAMDTDLQVQLFESTLVLDNEIDEEIEYV
ncbi:hypothetical protein OR1_02718 [Geobacter sp. OR-1]|uniref:hypothetical protein n=1 Tax=Geobacter sp. OR-1 TaxID=1266765 RepID=UPI0005435EDA|nr:hypothetical protein [Geobacter sp. OR-1]GAM10429.1 hypothetical protein OR1_02718 [Geobacter sp. OR-1]